MSEGAERQDFARWSRAYAIAGMVVATLAALASVWRSLLGGVSDALKVLPSGLVTAVTLFGFCIVTWVLTAAVERGETPDWTPRLDARFRRLGYLFAKISFVMAWAFLAISVVAFVDMVEMMSGSDLMNIPFYFNVAGGVLVKFFLILLIPFAIRGLLDISKGDGEARDKETPGDTA